MGQTLSPAKRQLLALVRASLWQTPADQEEFSTDTPDWRRIGQVALEQTVASLTFEAALRLPPAHRPTKPWIQKALAFLESNRRTHVLIDGCVAESVAKLRNEGINAILLKGQAYARSYPRPEMRQCGDIDLYIGGSSYQQAYEAVKSFGWEREERFQPEAKHYGCFLKGVKIELHRIAGTLRPASADRRFQAWSHRELSLSEQSMHISGQSIPVPTPMFDVVFVFLHLYHHFLSGGIGLRQICDWTMLLHTHSKEIDVDELETLLKDFGLMSAWKRFTPIAVDDLGLTASECPLYSPTYRREADRILSHIWKEGNFGRAARKSSIRPKGYMAGKIHSFRRNNIAYFNKFGIDPKAVSRHYLNYIQKGIVQIIKDKLKGKTFSCNSKI